MSQSQSDHFLEIENVSKSFGAVTALQPTSLHVAKGSFLTIVGPSGCGKTTLLRIIAGFLQPDHGRILLHGSDVESLPPYQRSIGMVFQKLALFPHMTAAQNVAYPLKMRRFDPSSISERVEEYLSLVHLEGYGDRRPHELSGGQQQRVAIARALSFSPDLLLLDEPLSALDKKLREEMQLEFRRIQQQLGVTTVNVTHDQREALVMSDQIVVMNEGRVQQDSTPRDIYRAPTNRFVANFVGLTSFFSGTINRFDDDRLCITIGATTLVARRGDNELPIGSKIDYAVRAEQVRFLGDKEGSYENEVNAVVVQSIFEGDRMVYEVRVAQLGNASMYVVGHDAKDLSEHPPGSNTRIGWNASDGMVFPSVD